MASFEAPHSEFVDQNLQERQGVSADRQPIHDGLPPHEFVPSEFAPESGRCDKCGGGPLAEVHQNPVDQMARIADALERIANVLEERELIASEDRERQAINERVRDGL